MKSKSYRIEVSGNGVSFSVLYNEKDILKVFEELSEKFSFDKNYSVKVFEIKEIEILIIENPYENPVCF